ncbi:SDR family NAD(P)-dependent oxidoreductase [Neorhizobium galegae]|uniref:SDR family NAD(P)-dependent oxidoreductase n=1 Tax=Neorhizobium galegae TaxID=399 RepID=UPI002101FDE8|nr:SDR family NAD(P)-dependent oxidoreductase [Neorhizobium galegae]MCQ1852032.1 SDR family oxidoreductase [Neorhizobium galegae]
MTVQHPLFDLRGRHAVLTGSSRGLGFAMARGLASAGARVTLNGRDEATLSAAVNQLKTEGYEASGMVGDITKADETEAAFAGVGAVDVLVNNAGIQIRAPFLEHSADTWRRMFDTHVMGAVLPSQAVLPGMIERGGGKIINICSLMSEVGRRTVVPYTTMKGALKMLTRGMATELAHHNIQVNGIGPGYFATEMNRALMDDPVFDAFVTNRTPAARWGRPEELSGAAIFLASPASDFVNGQVLYVDGGILAAL